MIPLFDWSMPLYVDHMFDEFSRGSLSGWGVMILSKNRSSWSFSVSWSKVNPLEKFEEHTSSRQNVNFITGSSASHNCRSHRCMAIPKISSKSILKAQVSARPGMISTSMMWVVPGKVIGWYTSLIMVSIEPLAINATPALLKSIL